MSNISMIKCPHCKSEYQNFLATQLKAELRSAEASGGLILESLEHKLEDAQTDLAVAEEKLTDTNIKWAIEVKKVLADLKLCKDAYKDLRDTVQISCNPPDDCNDPKVLKTYMKACFEQALKGE